MLRMVEFYCERGKQVMMLTAEEVAERVRVHPETIRRMCRAGQIRCWKIGRQWRVDERDLDALSHGAAPRQEEKQ